MKEKILLLENVKSFFEKKRNNKETGAVPVGFCLTCWGDYEWGGKYYDIIKDEHAQSGSAKYNSFISDIVNNHVIKTHNYKR